MLVRYIASFLIVLLLVCAGLSTLPLVTHSQVPAGATVKETWASDITLDSWREQTYRVDDEIKADLEKGVRFVGSGVVRVRSTAVEVTPKEVSWERNKTNYTAPGARMVARVTWDTPADAREGEGGDIHVEFPRLRGIQSYSPSFHSGGYQKTGDGRWVFREVTAHRGATAVALARMRFALSAGLPITVLLHSAGWAVLLYREKKASRIDSGPPGPQPLPRVFYPSPVAEWVAWTLTICIFGFVAALLASFVIADGFESSALAKAMFIIQGAGFVVGLIVAWFTRRSVVTVRIDADGLLYSKGRGEPRWVAARWSEVESAVVKSRTYRGNTTTWLEVLFPDGRARKIPATINDFVTLRDTVLELYARHRAKE